MLHPHLFTFTDLQAEGDRLKTIIKLNAGHPIFKGHFPGQPVLPGVCMMQMVKEVTEVYIDKKIRLQKARELKFLSFIDPIEYSSIQMELSIKTTDDEIKVDARLLSDTILFFKFSGMFIQR
ncbi:3-hydroxyacyl-ACP dehydratase [Mucilaginibacter sp. L196]|uniref:3-hydroxyacyl-ACP dehydratase n=1 Tax=Mucilaginibacter sp. L196 TaxID=1641870 RepID=UPI00131B9EBD|nr:3-hydroxyacyl-ACP dehydratase [Mucilaginibacter sp. L196]